MTVADFSGDYHQVGNDDAPTNPPLETVEAVIRTASQLHRPSNNTDATFDPVAKTLSLFEPRLLFTLTLPLRQMTSLWDRELFYAHLACSAFVVRREKGTISCQDMRRMMEQTLMFAQRWHKPGLIRRIAQRDHFPSHNQAAIHFGIVHLVTELGVVRRGFASTNDLRVRLNETDDFVSGRYAFAFQHAAFGLCDHLLNQREHRIELLLQALCGCR